MQKNFLSQVKDVVKVVDELGNPFSDSTTDLYTLDTKLIMPHKGIQSVRNVEDIGKIQYQRFVKERINGRVTAFNDTIPKKLSAPIQL